MDNNIKNNNRVFEYIDPEEALSSGSFHIVESFIKDVHQKPIGWHYIIDLIWLYSKIKEWPANSRIIDVGGGTGPLQFLLAEMGFNITNIDLNLSIPPKIFQKRYSTEFHLLPSFRKTKYKDFLNKSQHQKGLFRLFVKKIKQKIDIYRWIPFNQSAAKRESWRKKYGFEKKIGEIKWLGGNICHAPEIQNDSFDAVVSLSALEHIPLEELPAAIAEVERICKPGARWAVTTSASVTSDTWFHEPSQGYCFSTSALHNIFSATSDKKPNLSDLMKKYSHCSYLKNNLSEFYYKSGRNGMPWGQWDPKYIPVGIFC